MAGVISCHLDLGRLRTVELKRMLREPLREGSDAKVRAEIMRRGEVSPR